MSVALSSSARRPDALQAPAGITRHAAMAVALVATLACGSNRRSSGGSPQSDTPVLTLSSISPTPARDGEVVTIAYAADRAIESCAASFGGQVAACAPPAATTCSCTVTVGGSTPEGAVLVVVTASHGGRTGTATGTGAVDRTAPTVDTARLQILRHDVGADDAVAAGVGAVVDGGPSYPGARVVSVKLWDTLGTLLATVAPDADGSFAPVALPLTDGTTPQTISPAEVRVSAVDAAGNESAPVAIPSGADAVGPSANPDPIAILRRDLSSTDAVLATAGAVVGPCAVTAVAVEDQSGVLLGTTAAAADGSFPEVPIGTATASYPRAFVRATDKCGLVGARAEVVTGRDTDPPVIDPARILVQASASPAPDAVSGAPGGIVDAQSWVREVHLADGALQLALPFAPAHDGSFAPQGIGDTSLDRVEVQAIDKAGNASAWVASRNVEALLTLAGRQPHVLGSAPAALYAFADPADPRASSPGEVFALGDEVDATASAAAGAADGAAAHFSAAPIADSGAGWVALAGGPRELVSATLDVDRRRLVVFGGDDGVRVLDETWELDGTRWARIGTPHAPPARTGAAMTYDSARHVAVLFGGLGPDGAPLGDTWLYDGVDWTEVVAAPSPPPRQFAGMIFDATPGRLRAVLFGGCGADPIACELADTWELDAGGWSAVTTAHAPPARFGTAIAFDAGRSRTVLFGGAQTSGDLADHWEYDGLDWAERSGAGTPPARRDAAMAYDAGRGVVVLHGGDPAARGEETFELDGASASWSPGPPSTAIGARSGHVLVYGDLGAGARILGVGGWQLDDLAVLAYDGATWTAGAPGIPSGRSRAPMAFDVANGRLLLHGNGTDPFPPATDTWATAGDTFTPIATSVDPALGAAAMAYDVARARTVLFGCSPGLAPRCGTWEDSGSGWVPIATSHLPAARVGHSLAYDGAHGRAVLFGGSTPDGTGLLGDTWFYDGVDWAPATLAAAPTPRRWASLAYDAARDTVVLYGGNDGTTRDDTWELGAAAWAPRATAGRPPALEGAGMAYDAYRRVVTLYSDAGETWDLDAADWIGPTTAPAGPRGQPALAFDPRRRALDLFGGTLGRDVGDLWTLDRHVASEVWAAHAAVFTIDAGASLASAVVTYGGAALGDAAGVPAYGVELLAWNWQAGRWVSLGTSGAPDPTAGAIQSPLVAAPAFCRDGRIVVLAAPLYPSSAPGGAVDSEVWTDHVELRVGYLLP